MEDVKASAAWVAARSTHVTVDPSAIEKLVDKLDGSLPKVNWDFEGIHYFDNGPLTVQYLLVLDAVNFCFWPDEELNYSHFALGLKRALENDKSAFDADRLQTYTGSELRAMLKWPRPLPLEDERVRLLHEVGVELERSFGGKASNLVEASGKSAVALVNLITRHFPGFRDHSVYKGHQVFIYKRAQIFVADLWGAFRGQGYGAFDDIGSLTIFADYIVPAILRQHAILNYDLSLAQAIESDNEIIPGSEAEVEIRACCIYAVEKMKDLLRAKTKKRVRDELEHLLDDNEDMAHLYLTRRHVQSQRLEGSALGNRSNSLGITSHLHRVGSSSRHNGSIISSFRHDDHDVEDLEMLLEAYFMQLEGTRNKILSVREYIDDTEDYVNIQLDNQRNELIQLQLILTIGSFAIAADTLVASIFGMNIPCTLYSVNGLFWPLVLGTLVATVILFLLIVGYSRWKRLIGV